MHQLPVNGSSDPEAGPSDISEVLFADPDALVEVTSPSPVQGYLTYKKMHPLGHHRRPMPRVLGGS